MFVEFPGDRYAKSPRKVRIVFYLQKRKARQNSKTPMETDEIWLTNVFNSKLFLQKKRKLQIISRDSYRKWVMEVYYYPGAVGFSEWHKLSRRGEMHIHGWTLISPVFHYFSISISLRISFSNIFSPTLSPHTPVDTPILFEFSPEILSFRIFPFLMKTLFLKITVILFYFYF